MSFTQRNLTLVGVAALLLLAVACRAQQNERRQDGLTKLVLTCMNQAVSQQAREESSRLQQQQQQNFDSAADGAPNERVLSKEQRQEIRREWMRMIHEFLAEDQAGLGNLIAKRSDKQRSSAGAPTLTQMKQKKWSNSIDKVNEGFIMKPSLYEDLDGAPASTGDSSDASASSALGASSASASSNKSQRDSSSAERARLAALNSRDHVSRILNDQFGIRKESTFTTNNHLGLKGVPKFGSEEDY